MDSGAVVPSKPTMKSYVNLLDTEGCHHLVGLMLVWGLPGRAGVVARRR